MKQCPVCKTTYTDGSLRYCLADGSTLVDLETEDPTVVSTRRENAGGSSIFPPSYEPAGRRRSPWVKALIAAVIVGLLLVLTTAVAFAILYYNTAGRRTRENAPTPTPFVSPTPDAEKERLQNELANLQKKLEEQKNSNSATPAVNARPFPSHAPQAAVTARVNSPNDGFLALRDEPDLDSGERIAKIPHGATVVINNCERTESTIDGRRGRWCQIEYDGETGYVFDAWLIY